MTKGHEESLSCRADLTQVPVQVADFRRDPRKLTTRAVSGRLPKTGYLASIHRSSLHLDLREQVGADRKQDRGESAEDREVGRDAKGEAAVERAAQAVDAGAERVEPHG